MTSIAPPAPRRGGNRKKGQTEPWVTTAVLSGRTLAEPDGFAMVLSFRAHELSERDTAALWSVYRALDGRRCVRLSEIIRHLREVEGHPDPEQTLLTALHVPSNKNLPSLFKVANSLDAA